MRRNFFVMGLLTFFSVLFCVKTSAFEVSSGKTCGTARCGERVTFSFSGKLPEMTAFLRVRTFINGRCTGNSVVPAAELKPVVLSTDRPGWLAVKAVPLDAEKKVLKTKLEYGDGVLVEPEKLVPRSLVSSALLYYYRFDILLSYLLARVVKLCIQRQTIPTVLRIEDDGHFFVVFRL